MSARGLYYSSVPFICLSHREGNLEVARREMAENEVKARKKLEEAEKKAKGGGGFLGSLFGGSKADEAADLFVQ
uniref:Uncharacterized protein n=1 Tax=Parascaris equorum TaxID=6256 RepID=A0A914RJJ9_PAREQ